MSLSMSKKELLESLQLGIKLGLKQVYVSACTGSDGVIPVIDKLNSLQESVSIEKPDLGDVKELVVCTDKDLGDNPVLFDEDEVLDKVITEQDIFEEVEKDEDFDEVTISDFEDIVVSKKIVVVDDDEEDFDEVTISDFEDIVVSKKIVVVDDDEEDFDEVTISDFEDIVVSKKIVVVDDDEEEEEIYENVDEVTISDFVDIVVTKKVVVDDDEEEEIYEDAPEEFVEIPAKIVEAKVDIVSKENTEAVHVVKKFNVSNIVDCEDKHVNIALNRAIEELKPDAKALKTNIVGDKIKHNHKMTLLEFLRSNPSVNRPDVVEKYYSKAEIRKLIDSGSAFMKGGKIII